MYTFVKLFISPHARHLSFCVSSVWCDEIDDRYYSWSKCCWCCSCKCVWVFLFSHIFFHFSFYFTRCMQFRMLYPHVPSSTSNSIQLAYVSLVCLWISMLFSFIFYSFPISRTLSPLVEIQQNILTFSIESSVFRFWCLKLVFCPVTTPHRKPPLKPSEKDITNE